VNEKARGAAEPFEEEEEPAEPKAGEKLGALADSPPPPPPPPPARLPRPRLFPPSRPPTAVLLCVRKAFGMDSDEDEYYEDDSEEEEESEESDDDDDDDDEEEEEEEDKAAGEVERGSTTVE
jgi:hypothetical protein